MKTQVLFDKNVGAALFNSETRFAYGPLFVDEEAARNFLKFCPVDPVEMSPPFFRAILEGWKEQTAARAAITAVDGCFAEPLPAAHGRRKLTG